MSNLNGFQIKDGVLIKYYGQDEHVIIPEEVKKIGRFSFDRTAHVKTIEIPSSVTEIGSQAFDGCGLTSVYIPASVTVIGRWVSMYEYGGCRTTNFGNPFTRCQNLTSITIDPQNPVYHSAGNCIINTELKSLIGGCKTSVIPDDGSVTSIEMCAFFACDGLESVVIPPCVNSIRDQAFQYCHDLKSANIPFGVTKIGHNTFEGCAFTSINIPDSVTSIEGGAFYGCRNLTSIEIPPSVTGIGSEYGMDGAFAFTSITSIKIPAGVTQITNKTFWHCEKLETCIIPASVTKISRSSFAGCTALKSVTIEEGNPKYRSLGNCIIDIENAELILGNRNSVFPTDGSVVKIGDSAFEGILSLKFNEIPNGISEIGENAFALYGPGPCVDDMKSFKLPESVTSIGHSAFQGRKSLTSINIPSSVKVINNYTFNSCEKLKNIVLPSKLTKIGISAFYGCKSLTSIQIPKSVKNISSEAFAYCTKLNVVEIPGAKTKLCKSVFSHSKKVVIRTVRGSLAEDYALKNKIKLEYIGE